MSRKVVSGNRVRYRQSIEGPVGSIVETVTCIFTSPEIASVDLNTDRTAEQGIDANVSRFSFGALGKALAMGEDRGFVQLVTDAKTEKLLGCQIMGPHASDLIHEAAVAIRLGATAKDISETIHAHPSLPESIMEAPEVACGMSIHIAPRGR